MAQGISKPVVDKKAVLDEAATARKESIGKAKNNGISAKRERSFSERIKSVRGKK